LPELARDPKDCPTPKRLKELFEYRDGELIWKVTKGSKAAKGRVAGGRGQNGYFYIRVDYVLYTRHRLIWAYHNGWPEDRTLEVDHVNREKGDDRIENLRLVTAGKNQENNNAKGYCYDRNRDKYKAGIKVNGKTVNLGRFDTQEEARAAYIAAKLKYHTHG